MRSAVLSAFLVLAVVGGGCRSGRPKTVGLEQTKAREAGWTETGDASWYGHPYHGRRTASGEVYDMHDLTAAHRSLPFGTRVRVTRRDTGADVVVRITDRGPFIKGRIIDLSLAAAEKIGLDRDGVAPVKIKVLGRGEAKGIPRREADTAPKACYWVQVGAFGDVDNARRAVDRLRDSGEKAVAIEGPSGLERVRVGPFEEQSEANKARRKLLDDWPKATVVECGG